MQRGHLRRRAADLPFAPAKFKVQMFHMITHSAQRTHIIPACVRAHVPACWGHQLTGSLPLTAEMVRFNLINCNWMQQLSPRPPVYDPVSFSPPPPSLSLTLHPHSLTFQSSSVCVCLLSTSRGFAEVTTSVLFLTLPRSDAQTPTLCFEPEEVVFFKDKAPMGCER